MQYLNDDGEWDTSIQPDSGDTASLNEIAAQRVKWNEFLVKHPDDSHDEPWLWQYWKDSSRPTKLEKGFLRFFSSRLKAQKKLKKL